MGLGSPHLIQNAEDLTQQEREDNLKRFRNGDIDVMIATEAWPEHVSK